MATLPKEDEQRIEQEAKNLTRKFRDDTNHHSAYKHGVQDGYQQGAGKYCLELHTLQQDNERLRKALENIIEMNRQQAEDQYGNPDRAETWSCVKVARAALTAQPEADNNKKKNNGTIHTQ